MPTHRKHRSLFGSRRSRKRRRDAAQRAAKRELRVEGLEDRMLLAVGPQLVAINPNEGSVLDLAGTSVLDVAPRDLTFVFDDGQVIDPSSIGGIRISRSDFDGDFSESVSVDPGFVGIGDSPNEVVVRFAETLPDDVYRIEIIGSGTNQLQNISGVGFNDGADMSINFELDLGAQIVAVVPQPITRNPQTGVLSQAGNQIVVYFNNDDLLDDATSAENPAFYQLIFTNDTVTNTDDGDPILPIDVDYDPAADTAVLTFAAAIDELPPGPGTYRLRIGTDEAKPDVPLTITVDGDPGSSFDTARRLGPLATQGQILSSAIDPNLFPLEFPGGIDEPGHRDIPIESHFIGTADKTPGITTLAYNFKDVYGVDPAGNILHNLITETQKQRARDIFELYGHFLGVQFFETEDSGLTIVTGDLRALDPEIATGPGGVTGLTGDISGDGNPDTSIMDNAEVWNDAFGENWFQTAMHEIGHLLGLGHSFDLPPLTIQGDEATLNFSNTPERVFPGDHDIVHGQYLHRPESNDIDLYQFEVTTTGLFSAETIAERRVNSSLLDTALALYRENPDGSREVIARNDDYFSEDSFVELELDPGTYYIGVTSTGNIDYDPTIENTGFGGTSDGPYDLRLNFRPRVDNAIVDATGTALDGDGDGVAGGVYNFWFRTAGAVDPENTNPDSPVLDQPKTIFVDKSDLGRDESKALGSLLNPFRNIDDVFDLDASNPDNPFAANPGDIVRIVGNGGADGDPLTLGDNLAYELGFGALGQPLSDGTSMEVPQGVTVMIDAGAVFKLRGAAVSVGSSSSSVDRSRSALQVLGTPNENVFFTSFNDESIGVDNNPDTQSPAPGDWGGLIFRGDLDRASDRIDFEGQGIFLNYVNHAAIRFGGGNITIDSVDQVINPITMIDSRPTITFNMVTHSADAALSATPNSFEETNFHDPRFQDTPLQPQNPPLPSFTSDYERVGPDIHGNRLVDNTTNGLFVRIVTLAGNQLQPLEVSSRFDDTDIVHVLQENLIIKGTTGGPVLDVQAGVLRARLDGRLAIDPGTIVKLDGARIETTSSAQFIAEGLEGREIIFTSLRDDRFGAGGTFDTNSEGLSSMPQRGDWGGIYVGPVASASIDHALLAFGGGLTTLEGAFAGFNVIEIQQAQARITNSIFENNANGSAGQAPDERFGRGSNTPGTIFVRGAQPVIVNNVLRDNSGPAISINANSLNYFLVSDLGRTTGAIDRITDFRDNQGPLIRDNRLFNNSINGMRVRGATLTTQGVWDDTDIVHVVTDEIVVPDFHTFGGLRLESSPTESLVVKLSGPNAGFTATGRPLDIDDRIGGAIQVIGQPGFPVVLTSLSDNTVGAGFQPDGTPQTDTTNERLPARTQPVGSFQIDLRFGPALQANPSAVEAFKRAAAFWEAIIEDPVTIELDAEFGPLTDAAGIATPQVANLQFDSARQLLINDARDNEQIVKELPTFSDLNTVLPDDPLNPFVVTPALNVTRANALALGIDPVALPAVPSVFDPAVLTDGFITIDDDLNIIDTDIFSVALHEIGHTLGFTSGVDDVDSGDRNVSLTTMDLFRLAPGAGGVDFTNSPRILNPALDQVFYDGGRFRPEGIPNAALQPGDIPLATGEINGDGNQASHWKNSDLLGGIVIGIMDPGGAGTEITPQDRRALDLMGWDVVAAGTPGQWQGIQLDQYSHDRNVDVITELEPPDASTPGPNATPNSAQFLGALASTEKAGDDNLRLGFEVHGFLSDPSDVDVYSFTAAAGTEVWLDIDRTSQDLDAVVELVDANGQVLARSDNSLAESRGTEALVSSALVTPRGLQKSPFLIRDFGTTNPLDAGMGLNLPGPAGTTNTYHVRVRSSGPDLDGDLFGGETSGVYQLQLRSKEVDEIPGSTIRFADIRFATNGIQVRGQPIHSPLLGEAVEDGTNNDTIGSAQFVGNLLTTDRGVLSVAGSLDSPTDIDIYKLDINFDSIQNISGNDSTNFASVTFDLDYADGIANANTFVSVFKEIKDDNGAVVGTDLVLTGSVSDVTDDVPAPLQGADVNDLSRGSIGKFDPFGGPVELPEGTYFVAVTPNALRPQDIADQFLNSVPDNILTRLEPIDSIARISEDHVDGTFTTFEPPMVDTLVDESGIVPFSLGDVVLYVHQDTPGNPPGTQLHTVDPFTGAEDTIFAPALADTSDIAFRPDGGLFGLRNTIFPFSEGIAGNLLQFDTGDGSVTNLGDDGILTFEPDPDNPGGDPVPSGVGINFEALTFVNTFGQERLFAVGNRNGSSPPGVNFTDNIIFEITVDANDPNFPQAFPMVVPPNLLGAVTSAIDRGAIDTQAGGGPGGTITGITFVDEEIPDSNGNLVTQQIMYAVSNEGGLFRVTDATFDARTEFIGMITVNGEGVKFSGLTSGPPNVEGGRFKNTLFGLDINGDIFAFDVNANRQRIFVDGNSRISTGISRVDGLAFSTLDRNLFHVTERRDRDPGHGLNIPVDQSRDISLGGPSFYFGNEDPVFDFITNPTGNATQFDFNFPGGAHGSLITNPFDLSDVSPSDAPFLYFNYFLDTENANFVADPANPNFIRDSFRVFVSDDSGTFGDALPRGQWVLLATNDSFRDPDQLDEFDLVDSADGSLLRSPNNEFNFGEIQELFDSAGPGFTLTMPAASVIPDGETFTVDNGVDPVLTFEFDSNAVSAPGNIAIPLLGNETAAEVALLTQQIVTTSGLGGISTSTNGNELSLVGAIDVQQTPNPPSVSAQPLAGSSGWRQARIPLGAFAGSDSLRLRFDFSSAGSMNVGDPTMTGSELRAIPGKDLRDGDTFTIDNKKFEFDLGFTLVLPSASSIGDGETLTLRDVNNKEATFEFDKDGVSDPANVPIAINGTESASQLAALMTQAFDVSVSGLFGIKTHINGNRMNLENLLAIPGGAPASLQLEGEPGGSINRVIRVNSDTSALDVAKKMKAVIGPAFGSSVSNVKSFQDTIFIIGHTVVDPGPLGLADQLPGDEFGVTVDLSNLPAGPERTQALLTRGLQGQDNIHEGLFVDDLVIGLAGRGELVTGSSGNTTFVQNLAQPGNEISVGEYQLEIRRADEVGVSLGADPGVLPGLELIRSFDINDRLDQEFTLFAPSGADISPGQTFMISDGIDVVTFQFIDTTSASGVKAGNAPVPFRPSDTAAEVANRMVAAINDRSVREDLGLDVFASSISTSDKVELFGETVVVDLARLEITDVTTDGNALRDVVLGEGITPVGDATFIGGDVSAGIFQGGNSSIGFDKGIVLTTGDARFAQGPNQDDLASGTASDTGFVPLDTEFAVETLDSTVLEFSFETTDEDLFFNFVFASEEYNEFANSGFNDVFAFFIDGENIALVPGTTDPISINTINGGNPLGTDPVNSQFYNNNDLNDGGNFLKDFGYDGFTDVFTATKLGIGPGTHTIVLAISDVGDNIFDSAVFIEAGTFATDKTPDSVTILPGIKHDSFGDSNRFRDQGQILIESSTITNSAGFGILIEDGDRDIPSFVPHAGPVRNLRELNTERLTPGVTITNNIIAFGGMGGIHFTGDPNGFLIDFNDIIDDQLDGDTFQIFDIPGDSLTFELDNNGTTDPANVAVTFDLDPATPIPTTPEEIAAAFVDAVNATALKVTAFLGVDGELFVEGSTDVVVPMTNEPITDVGEAQKGGVPFGRIVNNTIVGHGGSVLLGATEDVGVLIEDNASPTLLNNIVANFGTGIEVDNSSQTIVLGGTLFQGNLANTSNFGQGDFPIVLSDTAPLFVDPADLNFYLAEGSPAIDSAIDSLQDRSGLITVKDPLGIALSPILAPTRDLAGQLRVDDPSVEPPAGLGQNVFKDRGALDRADFIGPSAVLIDPRDNDIEGNDIEPAESVVVLPRAILKQYSIQLVDGVDAGDQLDGIGVNDSTVTSQTVTITLDDLTLEEGVDYTFDYDTTNDIIRLTPLAGIWVPGTYVVTLDNSSIFGIRDLADNALKANQLTLATQFTIVLGERFLDFGDAPAPYPTLLSANGARHTAGDLFLGSAPSVESDGQPSPAADADSDDGVVFNNILQVGNNENFTVTASASSFLDAWIDLNGDGDWDDAGERIFDSEPLVAGQNNLTVKVPSTAAEGVTFARFRISSTGGLLPTGEATNGEVEDYQLTLKKRLDFGDAPLAYPTLLADDGARHLVTGLFLGNSPSSEDDGQPSPSADADSDDGVGFNNALQVGLNEVFTVTASEDGFLDAWIDLNGDGDWDDAGEQIFTSEPLLAGANQLSAPIPVTATRDVTFARFRISSTGGLLPTGEAADGEVEDYQVTIEGDPWQNSTEALDVNADGRITPLDALLVINELNNHLFSDPATGQLPSTPAAPNVPLASPLSLGSFVDVTGPDVADNFFVTQLDALRIINHLNDLARNRVLFAATGAGAANRSTSTAQSAVDPVEEDSKTVSTFNADPSQQLALLSTDPLMVTFSDGANSRNDNADIFDRGLSASTFEDSAAIFSSRRSALLASTLVQQYDSLHSENHLTSSSLRSMSKSSGSSDLESLLSEIASDVKEAQQNETAHEAFFANFFEQ